MSRFTDTIQGVRQKKDESERLAEILKNVLSELTAISSKNTPLSNKEIANLNKSLATFNKTSINNNRSNAQLLSSIKTIVDSINVPPPHIASSDIDLLPLKKKLSGIESALSKNIQLDNYKPHDIINVGTDKQYIGFVDPAGNWYIVENYIKKDKMRYVFGRGNYTEAIEKASNWQYKVLNEAVDEAKT